MVCVIYWRWSTNQRNYSLISNQQQQYMNEYNVKTVKCGNAELPYKFTKRALSNAEKLIGKPLASLGNGMSMEDTAAISACALNVGSKLMGLTNEYTVESVFDLDDKYGIIETMMESFTEDGEKQMPPSQER